jgi:hypothetical protein
LKEAVRDRLMLVLHLNADDKELIFTTGITGKTLDGYAGRHRMLAAGGIAGVRGN